MITNDCKMCDPCEGCDADYWIEDGKICSPCASCEPCFSSQKCSWCGDGICRSVTIVESKNGCSKRFHQGCHEQDRAPLGNPGASKNG